MIEEWNENLRCPVCRKTGIASLSQGERDETPNVLTVPNGFRVEQTEFGPDFQCADCNVRVDP
jgi:hypothetical protein